MEELGHPLTWTTHCFLDGGCGRQGLFGHTNGFGDFVLFDPPLGWPWPIHECYAQRFELASSADTLNMRSTSGVQVKVTRRRSDDSIFEISADVEKHRAGISVIGTVTNVEKSFVGRSPLFSGLSNQQKSDVNRALDRRRSHIVLASGDGYEYGVFVDLDKHPLRFRDTVAAKIKPMRLMNHVVFVATQLVRFNFKN